MNFKFIMIAVLAWLSCLNVLPQNSSEIRNFIKTVPVYKETRLEVFNKYGNIEITHWNNDSAMIRTEIRATAANGEKLKKMFDGVSVNMSESRSLIRTETLFSQSIGMLFENFKGMTSKLITYDSRIEVNYYINIPDHIDLKIENKYGDVYMEDNSGEFSLSLSNGSFKADKIGKNASLSFTFCDVAINSISSGKLDASFSDISLNESGNLTLNSTSSKFKIKNSGSLEIESRRDKFMIDKCTSIRGTSYFTDVSIEILKEEVSLSTRYGNLNIDLIESGFQSINFKSGYSDLSLTFEEDASFNIDIRHLNAFLVISDKSAKTEKKVLNEDKKEYLTTGTIGKDPTTSKVTIDATRGNIYLK